MNVEPRGVADRQTLIDRRYASLGPPLHAKRSVGGQRRFEYFLVTLGFESLVVDAARKEDFRSGLDDFERDGRSRQRRQPPLGNLPTAAPLQGKSHRQIDTPPALSGNNQRQGSFDGLRRKGLALSIIRLRGRFDLSERSGRAGFAIDVRLCQHAAAERQRNGYGMVDQYIHVQMPLDQQRLAAVEPGREPSAGQCIFSGRRRLDDFVRMGGPLQLQIFVVRNEQLLRLVGAERLGRVFFAARLRGGRGSFDGLQRILPCRVVRHDDRVGRNRERRAGLFCCRRANQQHDQSQGGH